MSHHPPIADIDWTDYFQAIPSLFCILLQPVTYKIEVGVITGIAIYFFMMIVSLRFALYVPAVWNALPKPLQGFVASQSLNAKEQAKLEALGYSVPKSTTAEVSAA